MTEFVYLISLSYELSKSLIHSKPIQACASVECRTVQCTMCCITSSLNCRENTLGLKVITIELPKIVLEVYDIILETQAHKTGRVTAICTTPYGDVWTGSSRGVIRVRNISWSNGHETMSEPRELRRQGGMKAAQHGICFLVMPSGGQVIMIQ